MNKCGRPLTNPNEWSFLILQPERDGQDGKPVIYGQNYNPSNRSGNYGNVLFDPNYGMTVIHETSIGGDLTAYVDGFKPQNGGNYTQTSYLDCTAIGICKNTMLDAAESTGHSFEVQILVNDWSSMTKASLDDKVKCCSNNMSDTNRCFPDWCVNSDTSSKPGIDGCVDIMKAGCTYNNWAGQYESYCDQYSILKGDAGKALVKNVVTQFYITDKHKPNESHPFVKKAAELCGRYPGLCDSIMKQVCGNYNLEDLQANIGLMQTCGCFLNKEQYNFPGDLSSPECTAVCKYPGAIPIGTEKGLPKQCSAPVCVLDKVSISEIQSKAGVITVNQVCPSNGAQQSSCYIGVNLTEAKNTGELLDQIKLNDSNCGSCYIMNDAGSYDPIGCTDITPTVKPVAPPSTSTTIMDFLKAHRTIIAGSVFGIVLLLALWMIAASTRKSKRMEKLKPLLVV